MQKTTKRRFSLLLAAVMAFGSVAFAATANAAQTDPVPVAADSYGLPDKIEDGAILHCWCWNFNTIKANLPRIAQAGFKSIQTSPINEIKKGDGGKMSLKSTNKGNWWYQYQPTDYTIGNYMLGTEDEFKEMCAEAHKYGIKVIVDIVANHCSSDESVISNHVKTITQGTGKTFHDRLEISDWSNRRQITQGKLTGLMDLNTQNSYVQQMIVDYMANVRADGADGFRFDAAKHIELPDDDAGFAGNFWPTVLNNDAEFQYGEILTGGDRAADYAKLMKITADAYGSNLRTALEKKKLTATSAKNYRLTGVDAKQIVTWVESHDNYCTDDNPSQNQYSSWYILNNEQIQQGWAVIAAQGDTTPLFFARPKGSTAGPNGSKWGQNTIGLDGDENYYSDEVVAVNKFRNAMVGESKTLSDVIKQKLTMIERGSKGVCLVNVADENTNINVATKLADGEYTDHANGGIFTVKDGKLTGTVPAGGVTVLYQEEEPGPEILVGDINGDKVVNITDATLLQRHLAEFKYADGTLIVDESDPKSSKIADFNCDNYIDINDVTAMQRMVAEFD